MDLSKDIVPYGQLQNIRENANKDKAINEAKKDMAMSLALRKLLEIDDMACRINVKSGDTDISVWICDNKFLIEALDKHMAEITKFLLGAENKWQ